MSDHAGDPASSLMKLMSGYWVSQGIRAAAILGVADQLKDGPKHHDDLAKATGAHSQSLYRLLRALASVGIFEETAEKGVFQLTPLADLMRSDVEGSCKHAVTYLGSPEVYNSWGNILHSIKTGEPAFDSVNGCNAIDYAMTNPEFLSSFGLAMASYSLADCPAIISAYDFSTAKTVIDVGGGRGSLLKAILTANPHAKGILFDLPPVVASAQEVLAPVIDRCQLVSGSFFNEVPPGADVIVMKSVIHDWDDDFAQEILSNCCSALEKDGKLLVCERVIPPGNEVNAGKLMDLEKLIMTPGGKERTLEEFSTLLKNAGFEVVRVIPTQSSVSIIEASKA